MAGYARGVTVWRDRRATKPDPRNPNRTVPGEWDPALSIELVGVYLDVPSSTAPGSATRSQVLSDRALFDRSGADVQKGDRIRVGGTFDAPAEAWLVDVPPASPRNPFTGTVFAREISLELVEG